MKCVVKVSYKDIEKFKEIQRLRKELESFQAEKMNENGISCNKCKRVQGMNHIRRIIKDAPIIIPAQEEKIDDGS